MITLSGFSRGGERFPRMSILSSDVQQSLRRLKPEKRKTALQQRRPEDLLFIEALEPPFPKLLADTTVYIDTLNDRFPIEAEEVVEAAELWHSTVTEAELSAACGLLNPSHAGTAAIVAEISSSIDRRSIYRTLTPDRSVWRDAGILSGTLARLQRYDSSRRRQVLNDALIYYSALKNGCAVLTRNTRDFDFLQQLAPAGCVVFYETI
jgi:predicted nucleic acid-binding protein